MNSNPILQRLHDAENALRSNLHRHDLDETARAHMERALNHTREAYVATNELGKARTVERLVGDLEKVERLTEQLRKRQPEVAVIKLGRYWKVVHARRKKLGVPYTATRVRLWTITEEKLLGSSSDKEIAQRLKRTADGVAIHRAKLGIPARNTDHQRWTPKEDRLLGRYPDQELGRRLNRSASSVQHRRLRLGIPHRR